MAGLGRPLTDPYELPFWDLTTVTVWALMREPGAARMAADEESPYALHDAKAAHVDRMRDVWDLLWGESGRPKPDDPNEASVELLCDDPAVQALLSSSGTPAGGSSLAGGFRDRRNEKEKRAALLRRLEAEGAIQLHWPFPIDDYLMELIRKGRLEIRTRRFGGEAMTAIGLDECAILEIAGDIDERCYLRRKGEGGPAFAPALFSRDQVLQLFPAAGQTIAEAPVDSVPAGEERKGQPSRVASDVAFVADVLRELYGPERPPKATTSRKKMQHDVSEKIGRKDKPISMETLDRALRLAWPHTRPLAKPASSARVFP